jgi:hypothetical protein
MQALNRNQELYRVNRRYTSRATLVALGLKVEQLGILKPIFEKVHIGQKVILDTPNDKLVDALIAILAGAHGLVETNKRVRPDRVLQQAFGRKRCADQSVISDTLNTCTTQNVEQMQQAIKTIYQQHSLGYPHNYEANWQLIDVDMTGQPCGKKAAFATKGYFANQRNRRGRQLGRVLATWYNEVVIDRLFDGKTQLPKVLQQLLTAASDVLELDQPKRSRTILRIDAHGGSLDDINWILSQGYQIHIKEYSGKRARQLAQSVTQWYQDPKVPGRQIGLVSTPATEYVCPVQRIAVRTRKNNGQWGIGVIISTIAASDIALLIGLPVIDELSLSELLSAYVHFYDLRSGGVETSIKQDKQGLGITKRNKKRFEAQQMLTQLNVVAHNLIIWFQHWLAQSWQSVLKLGILRIIRDLFHIDGFIRFAYDGSISQIVFNQDDPFATKLSISLQPILTPLHIDINLGQT